MNEEIVKEEPGVPHSLDAGIRLVLNGGNPIMEQATIPIQWFFSKEVAAKRPTHILIIEQDSKEIDDPFEGSRYLYKITDRVGVIQVFSPGRHRILALALNDSKGPDYLEKDSRRRYNKSIRATDIVGGSELTGNVAINTYFSRIGEDVVGAAIQEVEVPEELFARKPGGPLRETIWRWTNRWFSTPPRDQCEYRTRLIWAFTVQPLLFAIGMILRYSIAFLCTVLLPLLRAVVLFCGFRPVPFFAGIKEIWRWEYDAESEETLFRYDHWQYRAWEWSYYRGTTKRMPITGIEILAVLGIIWQAVKFYRWDTEVFYQVAIVLDSVLIAIGAVMAFIMLRALLNNWIQDCKDKEREQKIKELERLKSRPIEAQPLDNYSRWLTTNLTSHLAPVRVDLRKLPPAYKMGVVQKFRVGFWNVKMKICRPFAR